MSGGVGSAVGAFIGALISVVIRNDLTYWYQFFWQEYSHHRVIIAVLFGQISAQKKINLSCIEKRLLNENIKYY